MYWSSTCFLTKLSESVYVIVSPFSVAMIALSSQEKWVVEVLELLLSVTEAN